MKLKVIAGAKEGAEVPLKKSKFVIGRASDCTLRASSDAISRHHCELIKSESGVVTARDLGSRNGTLINGEKIEQATPIKDGDELQVGPLRFLVIAPADLSREKKPKVKSVAEAVERVAQAGGGETDDDDISRWLLGPEPLTSPPSMRETKTFRLDETQTVGQATENLKESSENNAGEDDQGEETLAVGEATVPAPEDASGSKKKEKRKPGKLPPLPQKPLAKDSREAAADILREMARRR